MSENSNSSNSGCGIWSVIFVLLIALFFCNKCVYPVLNEKEIRNDSRITQLVFLDSPDAVVDGRDICPLMKCKKWGFMSKNTHMLYTIKGADSCAVISDVFDKVGPNDYLYDGKLITDNPIAPITELSGIKGGETLWVRLVEDGMTRINNREVYVYSKFYLHPRSEDQHPFQWIDSCLVHARKEVDNPWIKAVFVSKEAGTYSDLFIGDYTPSTYEPEEYIAKLDKNAYQERNLSSLKINDVDIKYYCEGYAANVKVTFEPVTDTLFCRFVYHVITEYNWARSANNTRFGWRGEYIMPGQTEVEFNITPDRYYDFEKIADLAIVGVTEGDSLKIVMQNLSHNLFGQESSDGYFYYNTYDHRSSFWQKITLRRDLCASHVIVYDIFIAILGITLLLFDDKKSRIIGISIIALTVIYAIMWFILVFF